MRSERQEFVPRRDRLLGAPIEPAVLEDQAHPLGVCLCEIQIVLVVAEERAAEHHRPAHDAADRERRRHRAANAERHDVLQIVACHAVVAGRPLVHVGDQQRFLLADGMRRETGPGERGWVPRRDPLKQGQPLGVDVRSCDVAHLGAFEADEDAEITQHRDGTIDRDLCGGGRSERLRYLGHHVGQ
jgi:hypothetical protein